MSKITELRFGVYPIPLSQVFLLRKNIFGIINNKPFAPGHVLLCSRKIVSKLEDLEQTEVIDLFVTAQEVCQRLESITKLDYEITLQNGAQAGQTVKHLHLHIVPKHKNPGLERFSDSARSNQDMAQQASRYRPLFDFQE